MLRHTQIFATAREHHNPQSADAHLYHRDHYAWSFGVESRPAMGLGKVETAEYGADWDDDAGYHRVTSKAATEGGPVVGRLTISDGSHESLEHFAEALSKRLHKQQTSLDAGSESEEWFRHALHELQDEEVLTKFDRDAFFKYAHGYLARRQSDAAGVPETIVYPDLKPRHQHKSGFWVSHPMADTNDKGGLYGGLM